MSTVCLFVLKSRIGGSKRNTEKKKGTLKNLFGKNLPLWPEYQPL